jgi:hypothetical protein
MTKKWKRPADEPVPPPGITLHFRNADHYSEWRQELGVGLAVQMVEGITASANTEKWTELTRALVEAMPEDEGGEHNGTAAILALRRFFNIRGKE